MEAYGGSFDCRSLRIALAWATGPNDFRKTIGSLWAPARSPRSPINGGFRSAPCSRNCSTPPEREARAFEQSGKLFWVVEKTDLGGRRELNPQPLRL